jgi:hypothetical protein
MTTRIRVVLNMNHMSIPEKINKAQLMHDNILANPTDFANPGTLLTDLLANIVSLRMAYADTADGSIGKVAIMRGCEGELLDVMRQVGAYVEKLTKADAGRAARAGLELKHPSPQNLPEFEARPGPTPGTVSLRTRPHKGMFYKWQYSLGTSATATWVDALAGRVSRALLTGIAPGFYWFRVVLVDAGGEHELQAARLGVN